MKLDAHKIGCELLNTILEMEDLNPEVRDRVTNALILIDPQPEESEIFHDALAYAINTNNEAHEALAEIVE